MKRFLKLTLEEKMVLGNLPIILVIVLIAAVSLQGIQELDKINKDILENDTVLQQVTDRMADNLLAQEAYGRRSLILQSREMREMFHQRGEDFKALVKRLHDLPDKQNIPVAQLASLHDEFQALYKNKFSREEPLSPGQAEEVDQVMTEKLDSILALIRKMETKATENKSDKMLLFGNTSLRIFRTTILLSGLGLLIGLAAIVTITRSASRSIRQLKQATEEISQGRFTHLTEISSDDELGKLAKSFNTMAGRLGRLEEMYIDSNPLTRLPGGVTIENVLQNKLESGKYLAFCMLDLDNFKSYNDSYGYAKGNEIIRATANIIVAAVDRHGSKDNFVGHIGGDDFAIIVKLSQYKSICEAIIRDFNQMVPTFYSTRDRRKGYIIGHTRQGVEVHIPLMSISIAVVTNEYKKDMSHIEVSEIAAELKEHAKSQPGSVYLKNQRGEVTGDTDNHLFTPRVVK
ncbi:MAG: diguanylate cyclase domain-containing protein [Desulfurivibrionaceae bacterium]